MSELRDRIARALEREDAKREPDIGEYGGEPDWQTLAQAIINEFDLTPNGETGYVEIWGCYDTGFED